MKKYLLLGLSFICVSCADMSAQMSALKSSLDSTSNATTSSTTSNNPNQKNGSTSTNKSQNSNIPSAIQKSNDTRSSAPDTAAYVKQEIDKTTKKDDLRSDRQKYKDLLSKSDSAFDCMPNYLLITNNEVTFIDPFWKNISSKFTDVKVDKGLVYFTVTDSKLGATKYVLDTKESKLIAAVNGVGNKSAMEAPCKKIK